MTLSRIGRAVRRFAQRYVQSGANKWVGRIAGVVMVVCCVILIILTLVSRH